MRIKLYGSHGEGKYALVDKEDYPVLNACRWNLNKTGYPVSHYKKKLMTMHKVVMLIQGVESDIKNHIDHINGDKFDNTRSNLRLCKANENLFNRGVQKNNKSGVKGVYTDKSRGNRFYSRIRAYGIDYYIGTFDTIEEAKKAYDAKAEELHGNYKWSNS